ncbi:GntR family transcriptional regulator [uncultured Alsobacter sp.]|uniref:GntR family transcriptional regulator n=1 Tax=uncultured Alsobacter sp. TaxID=1748258 RepID=UPI0025D62481|nr:GntR family transcriptional regulator [uncultured Alsobacter sp.]
MAAQPLKLRTLQEAIVDRLREAILAGEHPPGTQLRQEALAASYGVSRIPLREAFRQLEAEGLIEIAPHRGAVVTGLSPEEVRDVFALRRVLEARLLRASIPKLDTDDFKDLDTVQAAFADAIARGDTSQWGVLNARLHMALYGRAALPRTLSIVAGLLQTSERYTRLQLATREAWRRAQQEHGELIALARAGDIEGACALLDRHITAVLGDLERLLASTEDVA